jgi:hypothetical protein
MSLSLAVAACGGDVSFRSDRGVALDTLFGFKVGTLYPEVVSAAEARGLPLECSDEYDSPGNFHCRKQHPAYPDRGEYSLSFTGGRLVGVTLTLRRDTTWSRVSLPALRRSMAGLGQTALDTSYSGHQIVIWARDSVVRMLACESPSARASDCTISAGLLERTSIEELLQIIRQDLDRERDPPR